MFFFHGLDPNYAVPVKASAGIHWPDIGPSAPVYRCGVLNRKRVPMVNQWILSMSNAVLGKMLLGVVLFYCLFLKPPLPEGVPGLFLIIINLAIITNTIIVEIINCIAAIGRMTSTITIPLTMNTTYTIAITIFVNATIAIIQYSLLFTYYP